MLRINNVSVNNSGKINYMTSPSFKGNPPVEEKKEEIKSEQVNAVVDYNVTTPMKYNKLYEVELPFDLKAHYYKLANGQKVVIVPQEGATVLNTYVNTGSMNETDNKRGISHYLEHNFFNGSEGLEKGEFFKTVDNMGAYTNAATGMAKTNYYIQSNLLKDTDFENQLKIHASMLQSPKFAVEMLEKEKGIVNSEINMITSDPVNIGMHKLFKNMYNIDSKSMDLIGGTTDNINNITREDVVNYFNQNYYPANMTTVITGDVKPQEAIELVSKYFTSTKQSPKERYFEDLKPIEQPIREDIISDKAKATTILAGFNGPACDNIEDKLKVTALSLILSNLSSSRMEEKLKDLNTSMFIIDEKISSQKGSPRALIASAQTTEENSEKVLKVFYDEIEKIKVNPPTEEELNIVKKQMNKLFSSIFETSAGTNNLIGEVLLDSDFEEITKFKEMVDKMTAQDLSDIAKKYFDLNKIAITVVHPATSSAESIKTNHSNAKEISFGSAKTVLNENAIKSYILPNNMQVVTNDINTNQSNFMLEFKLPQQTSGVENLGASLILNYLLNQGSIYKDKQTIAKEFEKNGISGNFNAGQHHVNVAMEFASEDSEKAFKMMEKILSNPRFTEDEFNHAKVFVLDVLKITDKSVSTKLYEELFTGLVEGMTKAEIIEAVNSATLDDVKNLYSEIISNSQGSVVMSAPFEKNPELKNVLFNEMNKFDNLKPFKLSLKNTYKPIEKTKVLTDSDATNQAKIVEAFTYEYSGNMQDSLTIGLMNIILGDGTTSRLFQDLREEQKLAYSVKSKVSHKGNTGIIKLTIGTTSENVDTGEVSYDNVQKAINGFNKNIERMINEKVSEEELESAKLAMKNAMLTSAEHPIDRTSLINSGLHSFYGITNINQKFAMIDNITVDDIQNVAKNVFSSKPMYSILATQNTLDNNAEFFKKLEISHNS